MTGAQRAEAEAHEGVPNDPEQAQNAQNPAMKPTVNLHRTKEEAIKEFVRRQGTITLDWYVPNFRNTQVGDLIMERLPIETTEGKILFNCPPLSESFYTSNFELDLITGRVYTYLTPMEDIGVACQKDEFDLEILAEKLRRDMDISETHPGELVRIPLVRKIAAPVDVMDLEVVEYKMWQYLQLWKLYADASVELKKMTDISRESAVTACRV